MIVIFEGPDGGGKDFVSSAYEESTKYEHVVVSRFMFSQVVYARYFRRPGWEDKKKREEFDVDMKKFLLYFRPLVVYCTADTAVLEERIRRRGELVNKQPNADTVKHIYDDVFKHYKVLDNLLTIDTSLEPRMEDVVSRIVGKVKSMERRKQ